MGLEWMLFPSSQFDRRELNVTLADDSAECPACRRRRENYQVVGLTVFCLSLVSCGTLMPIAIPMAFYLQVMSTRKCPDCRRKLADKPTGISQSSATTEAPEI